MKLRYIFLLVLFLLAGCTSNGSHEPRPLPTTIVSNSNINPNYEGRPSPLVVVVYQLSSTAAFDSLDFLELYRQAKTSLDADLISKDEFEIAPNQTKNFMLFIDAKTQYLGIIGAFSQVDSSIWRQKIKLIANKKRLKQLHIFATGNKVTIQN